MKHLPEDQIIYSPSHPVPPALSHPFGQLSRVHNMQRVLVTQTRVIIIFIIWSLRTDCPLNIVLVVEQISRASIFLVAMLFQASAAYCPQFIKSRVVKDKTWRKKDRFGMEPIKFWQFNRVLPSNVVAMDEYYDTPIAQRTVRSHIPSLCPSCCN